MLLLCALDLRSEQSFIIPDILKTAAQSPRGLVSTKAAFQTTLYNTRCIGRLYWQISHAER